MSPHDTIGTDVAVALAAVKTLVLVVGGLITYFSFKAYRRTRQRALALLASGFGIITFGMGIAGASYELFGVDLAVGVLVESSLVLAGFLVIAYSLYVQ